jgi:hypothetical protein
LDIGGIEAIRMGVRRAFNQLHGIKDGIEDEKRRFVERVNQAIFREVDTIRAREFDYAQLLRVLCFEIGCNLDDLWQSSHRWENQWHHAKAPPEIRSLTQDDFETTLQVLMAIHQVFLGSIDGKGNWLTEQIQLALSTSTCDLGVRWKDGLFYPGGPEELDRPLVEETLTWLDSYPNERKDYRKALEYYAAGDSLGDVVKTCYCALEGTARQVLNNSKTLDNNKDEILKCVGLSDGWKAVLATYIKYAHDFRHASPGRHAITTVEAEGYLYMTGLLIRLIIESREGTEPQPA